MLAGAKVKYGACRKYCVILLLLKVVAFWYFVVWPWWSYDPAAGPKPGEPSTATKPSVSCPPAGAWHDGLAAVPLPITAMVPASGSSSPASGHGDVTSHGVPLPPTVGTTTCGLRYVTFLLHSANWNLTQHVLTSLSTETAAHVVLVDVSLMEETRTHLDTLDALHVRVLYPHLPLTLSQGMEYIRRISMHWGLDFVLYSHNDAQYLRKGLIQEALDSVCRHQAGNDKWGVLFFHYDVFCAYRIEAMRQTGMWDIYVPNYKADFDYYNRMKCKGFTILDNDTKEPGASVLHHKSMTIKSLSESTSYEHSWGWWVHDDMGRFIYFWRKWGTDLEPWTDTSAYKIPFNGQLPERMVPLYLLFRYAWRDHRNDIIVALLCINIVFSLIVWRIWRMCISLRRPVRPLSHSMA